MNRSCFFFCFFFLLPTAQSVRWGQDSLLVWGAILDNLMRKNKTMQLSHTCYNDCFAFVVWSYFCNNILLISPGKLQVPKKLQAEVKSREDYLTNLTWKPDDCRHYRLAPQTSVPCLESAVGFPTKLTVLNPFKTLKWVSQAKTGFKANQQGSWTVKNECFPVVLFLFFFSFPWYTAKS